MIGEEKGLKPCPFCGQEAVLQIQNSKRIAIKCKSCGAKSFTLCLEPGEEIPEVVGLVNYAWNRRVNEE